MVMSYTAGEIEIRDHILNTQDCGTRLLGRRGDMVSGAKDTAYKHYRSVESYWTDGSVTAGQEVNVRDYPRNVFVFRCRNRLEMKSVGYLISCVSIQSRNLETGSAEKRLSITDKMQKARN